MAILGQPFPSKNFSRNYGKVLQFNIKKTGTVGRVYRPGKIRNKTFFSYFSLVYRHITNAWQDLSPEERQEFEERGKDFFVSGYELFKTEQFKSILGTKYGMCRYGSATYSMGY